MAFLCAAVFFFPLRDWLILNLVSVSIVVLFIINIKQVSKQVNSSQKKILKNFFEEPFNGKKVEKNISDGAVTYIPAWHQGRGAG
jgi:hypothetical protein